jgi:3-oxoacyl-[acyl-carrier-protein] synthase-3
LIIPAGGYRNPSTQATQEVTERENKNFRSDEDLYMDGMTVFNFAITEVPYIIRESLADNQLEINDISLYALHQANELMLKYINKKLKANNSKVPFCASEIGNTGPASIPLMLSTNYSDTSEDLSKSLLCGFGVGLTWGTAILNLNDTKIFKPIIYNNQI